MGYSTRAYGQISISPPLRWAQIKDNEFLPNDMGGDQNLDVAFVVVEVVQETDEGNTTVRTATAVEQRYEDEPRNYNILTHLQQLVDDFPGHTFAGRLNCEGEENGDMWRIKVIDNKVTRFDPRLVWPEESE